MRLLHAGLTRRATGVVVAIALGGYLGYANATLSGQAAGGDATTAGEFVVEPATQASLGFDWRITGDDNRSARVEVAYRKSGESQWREALPLLRLQNEVVGQKAGTLNAQNPFDYVTPNMFSGSILNLEADTAYEARLTLTDADGVKGETTKTVTVKTKAIPGSARGGSVYHVYPIGYEGPKEEPSFIGLIPAYYITCHTSDWQNAYPPRVQPGDTILIHAGLYIGNRLYYPGSGNPPGPERLSLCTLFDGSYYLTQRGTKEKPITIKAAGDGEVIFDGDGAQNLFNLMAADYNYFEGITVRNTEVAFLVGMKNIGGASGFALKGSRLYDVGRGVQSDWSGAKDFYIADNTFIGRRDPFRLMGLGKDWARYPGYPAPISGKSGSDYAVKIYGQGHTVAHNFVANWNDGIDIATYGNPDGTPNERADRVPVAIDVNNNDIFNVMDNCIEADGGARNIRVFRNRCFNAAGGALSSEPTLGGPVYFYENVVVNAPTGGALRHVNSSAGLLVYQNTFLGEVRAGPTSNEHFLNNLVLSGDGPQPVFSYSTFTNYSSSDFNGFRPSPKAEHAFEWGGPAASVRADYKSNPTPKPFKTLRAYSDATGQEKHSVLVDYDMFIRAQVPDPSNLQRVYWWGDNDLRLKPGTAAVDAGTPIASITDGFAGRAPDLGAYELNKPLPVYGPRGVKEEINPALKVTARGGPPMMKGTYDESPWKDGGKPPARAEAGAFKLYTFLMGTILVPDPKDFGLKKEEVGVDRLSALSYLIVHPKGTLIWDAGIVPDELVGKDDPAAERAMKSLSDHLGDLGYTYKGITYFAMSHAHADHAGNANAYAGSTWLVRKAERDAMFGDKPYPNANPAYYSKLRDAKTVIIDGDYDVFGDGKVVIKAAPGHTPGHQVLFLNLPSTGPIVLGGDLYAYPEQRTLNRTSSFDADPAQAKASREAIEAFLKTTGAQLWIQHDYRGNGQRKQSPAFYD